MMTPTQIKTIRTALDETQEQFAKRLHVSVRAVRNWEAGRHAPLKAQEKKLCSLMKRITQPLSGGSHSPASSGDTREGRSSGVASHQLPPDPDTE